MKISLNLKGHYSNSGPFCLIEINGEIFYRSFLNKGNNMLEFDFTPNEDNVLKIHHMLKTNDDTVVDNEGNIVADKAIELKSISIEQISVPDTVLYNKSYHVNWPENLKQNFLNEGKKVPDYIKNTLFFGFNGYYEFDFIGDFLKQYYRQFWENEDQSHNNQTKLISVDSKQVEAFDRFGEETAINQEFELTIHDLKKIIENE